MLNHQNKAESDGSKRNYTKTILITALIVGLLGAAGFLWGQPLLELFSDQERAKQYIDSAGVFGPLVFIVLQVVQVVIAPIPGQVAGLLGGYLFGPYIGLLYSLIGAMIGFTLIFVLARKLGRPFVERFFSKKLIDKFDHVTKSKGTFALFLMFLLPAFPDDLLCYMAGLTKIPIRTLIFISLAGRLPGYLLLSFTGNGLAFENMNLIIVTVVTVLLVSALAYWQRNWMHELIKSPNYAVFIKSHWGLSRRATIIWVVAGMALATFLYHAATISIVQQ